MDETIKRVYDEMEDMQKARNKEREEFGDLTLEDYIDDCDKRLNATIESSSKEDWQADVALPTVRNKLKRLVAGFSFNVPDLDMKAIGAEGLMNVKKASIAKQLVQGSYRHEDNPILENFWQAWEASAKGTVIVYEGYLKTKNEQKHIKSYDLETGEIETESQEVNVNDECISYQMPLTEFYIKDYNIPDVQDQQAVAWVKYYNKEEFDYEFGEYSNSEKVKEKKKHTDLDTSTYFYDSWEDRLNEDQIEVIRYYNRQRDEYIIVANGVKLLDAPLLWKFNGKKVYPFAKTIWEPFTSKHFFYGKSAVDVMQGLYDVQNTIFNTLLDKEFRNLVPPLLIGNTNRDAFELMEEEVDMDSKIYVNDINQVSPMEIAGPNEGDMSMLNLISNAITKTAPSISTMLGQNETTAREAVIAEEKMKQIKSVHQQMLVDLWKQKFQLRLANIQMNYPQPRTIQKDGETVEEDRTVLIPDATLDPATGEEGILSVTFIDFDEREETKKELGRKADVEEEVMKKQGETYKKVFADKGFFDNYKFEMSVVPSTIYETNFAKLQSKELEKLQTMAKLFPQIFKANQEEFFEDFAESYRMENSEAKIRKWKKVEQAAQKAQQQQQEEQ